MRLCIEPAYCFGRDMQDLTLAEQREYAREIADRTGRDIDEVMAELVNEVE